MFYRFSLLFFCVIINCQNIDDAISLTFENDNGNARFSAMSGAFGSLGGNLSAISINPASSSVFELSRMGFSLNTDSKDIKSSFSNSTSSINSNYFNFQGGIVYVFKNYGQGKFKKFSFGINNQNTNDFNFDQQISARSNNSVDQFFVNNSIGYNANDVSVGSNETVSGVYRWLGQNYGYSSQQAFLGFQSYLLDYDNQNSLFYSIAKYNDGLDINNSYYSKGTKNKSSLNLSAQYGENIYLGMNFNIYELYSKKSFRHIEDNFDNDSAITLIDFRNELLTRGKGFSFQIGMIYKLQSFRLGISYNSPTSFNIEEELEQSLETNSIDLYGNEYVDIVDPDITNIYEYKFKSPSKVTFSASNIFANMFIVSVDIQSNNYQNGNFKSDFGDSYSVLNASINENLKNTLNYSIGSELRLKSISIRAGIKKLENPYKISTDYLSSKSFGLGYDFGASTLDLGFQLIDKNYNYQFFDTGFTEFAQIKNKNFRTTLTYNIIF